MGLLYGVYDLLSLRFWCLIVIWFVFCEWCVLVVWFCLVVSWWFVMNGCSLFVW